MVQLRETAEGVSFAVKVQPRARRDAVAGELDGALKLALTAPPVEGRANQACVDFLAALLKVPRSSVSITSGANSRRKSVRVTGVSAAQVQERLLAALKK
jgi:uncharacterized protein (TIGR00251 family)